MPVEHVNFVHRHGFLRKTNSKGVHLKEKDVFFCGMKRWIQAHQVVQDDLDGQEMPRGVQQDAPMGKPGEVTDRRCVDVFLQANNESA